MRKETAFRISFWVFRSNVLTGDLAVPWKTCKRTQLLLLCGVDDCINPNHVVFESLPVNSSRKMCHKEWVPRSLDAILQLGRRLVGIVQNVHKRQIYRGHVDKRQRHLLHSIYMSTAEATQARRKDMVERRGFRIEIPLRFGCQV